MLKFLFGFIITLILLIISFVIDILNSKTYSGGKDANNNPCEKFQNNVYTTHKHLIPKQKLTFKDFCFPTERKLQNQQIFVAEFMKPGKNPRELLVYHKIGAGKTALSISVGEKWLSLGKPLFVMPASLIPGFRNEMREPYFGSKYLDNTTRDELKNLKPSSARYKEIISESDEKIDKNYNIFSYNKFLTDGETIDAPIIIIDEVQNINNHSGKFFKSILTWIENHPKASVVIMSGTPLFDSPVELYSLAKLLRIKYEPDFSNITTQDVKKMFAGKISYFQGAPQFTFPKSEIKIVQCVMSKFQTKWYKSEIEAEIKNKNNSINIPVKSLIKYNKITNDFYIKSRQRSNVVYPEGLVGTNGISLMSNTHLTTHLDTYSVKIARMMKKLQKNQLSFIYTNFTGYGGIKFIIKVLAEHGYKNYFVDGPGPKRYAIWSGDQNMKTKDAIRAVYNSRENDDASQLQIVIGSPSIKEGVTLLRTRQVHVIDPYWNHSRLEQIFGRAVRYCSHKYLKEEDRDVRIYIYAATTRKISPREKSTISPNESIDLYILNIADEKKEQCIPYLNAMIECAVDRYLWSQ